MTEPDNDKAHWIVGAVKTVGVPTVFLGILLYMIYASGKWAGIEVVVPLFKTQTEFINRTAVVVEEIRDAVVNDARDMNNVLTQSSDIQKDLLINREMILKTSQEQTELLKEIVKNTDNQQIKENERMIILQEIADNTKPKP